MRSSDEVSALDVHLACRRESHRHPRVGLFVDFFGLLLADVVQVRDVRLLRVVDSLDDVEAAALQLLDVPFMDAVLLELLDGN
jgi:hypothetical protein